MRSMSSAGGLVPLMRYMMHVWWYLAVSRPCLMVSEACLVVSGTCLVVLMDIG